MKIKTMIGLGIAAGAALFLTNTALGAEGAIPTLLIVL